MLGKGAFAGRCGGGEQGAVEENCEEKKEGGCVRPWGWGMAGRTRAMRAEKRVYKAT